MVSRARDDPRKNPRFFPRSPHENATQGLLEREGELGILAELAELACNGTGGVVLIEGPAGIGKTRLVQAWLGRAETRDAELLSARGSELERDFPFGAVRQLFELPLASLPEAERADLLSGAAGLAAPLLGNTPADYERLQPNEASYAILHGLYWMTANLAARRPILIAVDDVHWSDAPSLRFLVYLIRRIDELPILLVLAARPREPEAETELLEEIASSPLVRILEPAPLSEVAVAELVRAELSPTANDEFCAACRHATRGNPFFLRELLNVLAEDDATSATAQVERIPELAPSAIARSVLRRLERLPRGAPALARAVAILGDGADLRVAAELAELDDSQAAEAADALVRAGVFRAEPSLGFFHPIVRAAIYQDLAPVDRARRHAEAARMLARQGSDLDRVAMHLLAGEPSGESQTLETLREAAERAMARGAPEVAATYLRRALSEPPAADERAKVLLELGSASASAGEPGALQPLEQALEVSDDSRERTAIALELERWLFLAGNFREATEVLDRALLELGDGDRELAERLEAELLVTSAMSLATLPWALERVPRILRQLRGGIPDDPALLAMLTIFTATTLGPAAAAVELAERALAGRPLLTGQNWLVFAGPVLSLAWAGRPDLAAQACDEALREVRRRGSVVAFANVSNLRSHVAYRCGWISEAEADARRPSLEVAHLPEEAVPRPAAVAVLIDALLELGEVDAAVQALEESGIDENPPEFILFNFFLDSRGRLRLAQGRVREGLDDLLECGRRLEAWGVRNPGMNPWRSNAALALLTLGERDEARRLAREQVELAREFSVARELGMALRALGLIEGKERGIELLREAIAEFEQSHARLEHARALTDLGGALRRSGQRADARVPLRQGLDLALRCGATALAEHAHQELVATGARPRRVALTGLEALTASERRVAEMAAQGPTNREIAQALFVTEKTVEWHLGRVYRKLGISSRSQLPAALSTGR